MARVLIIDDDEQLCRMLALKVGLLGHQADFFPSLAEGLQAASQAVYEVAFLDVRLPDGSGLMGLPALRQTPGAPEVIIMTGAGDPDGAELAIKSGAWDYIKKPSSMQAMTLALLRALQYRQERAAGRQRVALRRAEIVGDGPAMAACLDLLAQAAGSEQAVLISGETGTGKELFARAIHHNSSRAGGPWVVVDCGALPENLVESLLFGHERGAFTGASEPREGLVRQAHGGTLFLDEVGELPLKVQKAFLRVLQDRRFRPLGGRSELASDFRLLAATNRDLEEMAGQGRFRQDLLFRLRGLGIPLPPLRQHPEDLRGLVAFHLERLCGHYQLATKGLSPDFLAALMAYPWPGNVRELVNTLEQVLTRAGQAPTLFPRHLPQELRVYLARASAGAGDSAASGQTPPRAGGAAGPAAPAALPTGLPSLKEHRRGQDRQYLQELLLLTGGQVAEACRVSGLSRSRLYELLKEHGLPRPGGGQ
ncbi:MAG: sigma-54-dependent Fis family transcriptional regulator [Desulfarculus sp.]|nr:sigma-54-dependent Fis family transcriptional regulator [Desulfarculus sp.]